MRVSSSSGRLETHLVTQSSGDEVIRVADDGFSVDASRVDGIAIIQVAGELDAATAAALEAAFDELDPTAQAVIDMAGIEFMDSTGVRVVLKKTLSMREAGGSLRIRSASPAVRRVLQMTSLDHLLFEPNDVD